MPAVDQAGVALVEDQQVVGALGAVVAVRLDVVVEPQDGGRGAPAEDAAHGVEGGLEGGEPVGRLGHVVGQRVGLEPDAGDHAERALGADEQLGEVGSGRLAGLAAGGDRAPVGQDHVESVDDVLDLPVAGRVLAGAAAGDPAADGGEGHRLGPVADRQAVAALELLLEQVAEGAGGDVDHERGVVDVADPGEGGGVEDDAAEHRHRRPADPAAPAGGGERHPGLVADRHHGGDLLGAGRPGDDGGAGRHLVLGGPDHRQRPPVAAGLGGGGRVGGDLGAHPVEPLDEAGRQLDGAPEPGRGRGGVAGQGDGGGGRSRSGAEVRHGPGP
jgi:hypothetical protein